MKPIRPDSYPENTVNLERLRKPDSGEREVDLVELRRFWTPAVVAGSETAKEVIRVCDELEHRRREPTHAKPLLVIPLGAGFPDYRVAPFCPWCGHETHSHGSCEREVTVPCCAGVKWERCRCAHWQHQVCQHGDFPFGLACKTCAPVYMPQPLAQRILAALEDESVWLGNSARLRPLIAELRALVTR